MEVNVLALGVSFLFPRNELLSGLQFLYMWYMSLAEVVSAPNIFCGKHQVIVNLGI